MSIQSQGKNLIFLISQPRSGSTLLQRILGSHPEIHTLAEPWIMLHPVYALRPTGYHAEYNASMACEAMQLLLQDLSNGKEVYFQGVRKMYTHIYNKALSSSGCNFFLDKTPRYYLIIEELTQIFPDARFIFMLRNPLAVISSILEAWTTWSWLNLAKYKMDILHAPVLLQRGIELLGEKAIIVRYEELVSESKSEVQKICDVLEIEYFPEMVSYGLHESPQWQFGDQSKVYYEVRPESSSLAKWQDSLDNSQYWKCSYDYLQVLGADLLESLGYDFKALTQIIKEKKPGKITLWLTLSLSWLLKKPATERNLLIRGFVKLLRFIY